LRRTRKLTRTNRSEYVKEKKATSDAVKILHRRYYVGRPSRIAELAEARAEDELARRLYELREKAGLTQERLAKLVGTTPSVISRLEDSDYEGHSLTMLKRIAHALDKRVEIRFVPKKDKLQPA
jgi:DNA-binding XRE family transcriptional regulator